MRHEVHAFEVEGISHGSIPPAMIGMWLPPEWAEAYDREPQEGDAARWADRDDHDE